MVFSDASKMLMKHCRDKFLSDDGFKMIYHDKNLFNCVKLVYHEFCQFSIYKARMFRSLSSTSHNHMFSCNSVGRYIFFEWHKGPSNTKKCFLPFRVWGTLRAVEYDGKNRFSKYRRFHVLNRVWSSVMAILHGPFYMLMIHTLCMQ